MKKLLAIVFAALFASVTFAEDDTEVKISTLDQDGDGLLTLQEASADEELAAQFDTLDVNADGKLGEDEIDSGPVDDFDEIGEDPVEQ